MFSPIRRYRTKNFQNNFKHARNMSVEKKIEFIIHVDLMKFLSFYIHVFSCSGFHFN